MNILLFVILISNTIILLPSLHLLAKQPAPFEYVLTRKKEENKQNELATIQKKSWDHYVLGAISLVLVGFYTPFLMENIIEGTTTTEIPPLSAVSIYTVAGIVGYHKTSSFADSTAEKIGCSAPWFLAGAIPAIYLIAYPNSTNILNRSMGKNFDYLLFKLHSK